MSVGKLSNFTELLYDLLNIFTAFSGDRDIEMRHFVFRTILKIIALAFFMSVANIFKVVSYQEVKLGAASFLCKRLLSIT